MLHEGKQPVLVHLACYNTIGTACGYLLYDDTFPSRIDTYQVSIILCCCKVDFSMRPYDYMLLIDIGMDAQVVKAYTSSAGIFFLYILFAVDCKVFFRCIVP